MSHDYKPSGSSFPGFALLVAIAALVVVLVSVRQPTQAARVWIPVPRRVQVARAKARSRNVQQPADRSIRHNTGLDGANA